MVRRHSLNRPQHAHVQTAGVVNNIAASRIELDQARLLVLEAALAIDRGRAKGAMKEIGMAKVVVPAAVGKIVDRAMQVFGAEGICQDTFLPRAFAGLRTLRYADGPDEVHQLQVGITELKRAPALHERNAHTAELEEQVRGGQSKL